MVYIFTFFGFMIGFAIGLGVANVMLRNRTKGEIMEDRNLRWKYGPFIWLFGLGGGWLGFWFYNNNFL